MKRYTLILLALLALVAGAQAAQWWFGGSADDTTFASQPKWKAKFSEAVTAAADTDTLYQMVGVGCVYDTLGTGANAVSKSFLIVGSTSPADSVWMTGGHYRVQGGKTWTITDLDYRGGLNFYGASFTWTGGSWRHPGTDAAEAVSSTYGFNIGATGTSVGVFDDVDILPSPSGEADDLYLIFSTVARLTFQNCAISSNGEIRAVGTTGSECLRFISCTYTGSGWINNPTSATATTLLDSLIVRDCVWTPNTAVDNGRGNIYIGTSSYTEIDGTALHAFGASAVSSTSGWVTIPSSAAAKKLVVRNFSAPLGSPMHASAQLMFAMSDTTRATVLEFENVVIGGGTHQDSLTTFLQCNYSDFDSLTLVGILLNAGGVKTSVMGGVSSTNPDSTAARWKGGRYWRAEGVFVRWDESGWNPPAGPYDKVIQWCGYGGTLSNIDIRQSLAGHGICFSDDQIKSNTWSPADSGKYCSRNVIDGYTYVHGGFASQHFGSLIDKGFGNTLHDHYASVGPVGGSINAVFTLCGDSTLIYDATVAIADPDSSTVVWSANQSTTHDGDGNTLVNVLVTGEAQYCFTNWTYTSDTDVDCVELNCAWYLDYDDFSLIAAQSIASTSGDTGETGQTRTNRLKWGGNQDFPLTVLTPGGLAGIGRPTATASAQLSDPGIGWGNPGFETPVLTRVTLTGYGADGATLYHWILTLADAAAYDEWLLSRVVPADSTDARGVLTVIPRN